MKIIEEKEEEKYFTLKNGKKVLISKIENNATEIKNETELLNCLNNRNKNYSIVDGIIYLINEKSNHQFIKNNNDNCRKNLLVFFIVKINHFLLHSAGILMPEESRTEFIQFCDKFRIVTPATQLCYAKIFDLWIFAFLHSAGIL